MSDIHAYRQIVELQVEIVRLSQKNTELENKCKQVQTELISRHKKLAAPSSANRTVLNFLSDRSVALRGSVQMLARSANLKPLLQRVWQSVI